MEIFRVILTFEFVEGTLCGVAIFRPWCYLFSNIKRNEICDFSLNLISGIFGF